MLEHSDLERAPRVRFRVLKTFKDPLSRLVAESVYIDKDSNLNWRNNKMSRLVVEVPAWLQKKNEGSKEKIQEDNLLKK